MAGFYPGPPYFFICKRCRHRFMRRINLGLFCPSCYSLKVRTDGWVRK